MKRSGSGRVARKIGAYDEESAGSGSGSQNEAQDPSGQFPRSSLLQVAVSDWPNRSVLTHGIVTVVKRPIFGTKKKRSSLRMSFGAGESDANDANESSDTSFATPKKSNLSRIAMEKNAQLKARSPLVAGLDEDRPTYSKDHLAELRNSTPTTPKDPVPSAEEAERIRALEIASKFGPDATLSLAPEASPIPTKAEIEEKKARRRRLAKEQSALDEVEDQPWASDDEGEDDFRNRRNEISLRPKDKWGETRLIHEDEDIAEGFDDYVDDGKIALSRKSEREAKQRRRAEMADLINAAEGSSDGSSNDSEEERNAAFAAAQSRAGRYGQKGDEDDGARTPPRITPLPSIGEILRDMQSEIAINKQRKEMIQKRMEELKEDRLRTEQRKQYLQEQLEQTAKEFEKLRHDAGMPALPPNGAAGAKLLTERGLDSLGTTPLATSSASEEE